MEKKKNNNRRRIEFRIMDYFNLCNSIDTVYFLNKTGKRKFDRLKKLFERIFKNKPEILTKMKDAKTYTDLYYALPEKEITKQCIKLYNFNNDSGKKNRTEKTQNSVRAIFIPSGGANKKY